MRQLRRCRHGFRLACALVMLASPIPAALAQSIEKPATPAKSGVPTAKPGPSPAAPRARIELTPSERRALDGTPTPAASTPTSAELLPTPEDAHALPPAEGKQTVIEQVRTSNRVSEVRVTPGLGGHTYTMTNREGRQPLSATDTSSGLSVPKFFTFEFGGTEERPASSLPPPPPSSSTPR